MNFRINRLIGDSNPDLSQQYGKSRLSGDLATNCDQLTLLTNQATNLFVLHLSPNHIFIMSISILKQLAEIEHLSFFRCELIFKI